MTRTYLSLATVFVFAVVGCANKNTDATQNPDGTAGDSGAVDGTDTADGAEQTPSRARKSTAPRGASHETKARRVTTKKPPRAPLKPKEEVGPNGLLAEAFALEPAESLPDFTTLGSAAQSFAVPNLDVDDTDVAEGYPGLTALTQNYAIKFSGSINIVEEAEYELCLHSDDGSRLLLEGQVVVDNDGAHEAAAEVCELVYLAAGEYMIEVHYFQAAGPLVTMHFAWAINGGDKVIVPTEVLFKPVAR
jgi:hypothetical protein